MRNPSRDRRRQWRTASVLAVAALVAAAAVPDNASAGFFDFLFGAQNAPQPAARPGLLSGPFGGAPAQAPLPPIGQSADGGGYAHCVRMCDGRYFPILTRSGMPPAQLCQAFCPASATRVFFGSQIDNAMAANGERYSEIENAYAYRKKLSAGCTCNGRDPTGLAPVDVSFDTTLRAGDIVATATGLVAYQGGRSTYGTPADFTPVANYAGLTAGIRAQLSGMKVAPVSADIDEEATVTTASIPAAGAALLRTGMSGRSGLARATPAER